MRFKFSRIVVTLLAFILQLVPIQLSAQTVYPEDGWWRDQSTSGRAFFIERQENILFISAFIYSDGGAPEWLTSVGEFTADAENSDSIGSYSGEVYRSSGGQCIGCEYVAPDTVLSDQSPLKIDFIDNQNGILDWSAESIAITRLFWSWENAVGQLAGTWLLSEIENNDAQSQLAIIEMDEISGIASVSNAFSGAEIGTVELIESDLILTLNDASETALPLIMPETKRFYAGFVDPSVLQVIAVRLDDIPISIPGDSESSCEEIATAFQTLGSANPDLPEPFVSATCADDVVTVKSNAIPDFPYIGTSPGDPIEADNEFVFPATPTVADTTTEIPAVGPIGVAVNGIPLYGPTEGPGGDVQSRPGGFVECGGHVGPSGYHYHLFLVTGSDACRFSATDGRVLYGYAFDGYPIYGGYDYTSSYELTDESLFATDTWSAHTYVEGKGDLDECNGLTDADGNYAYYATEGFPYLLGCFRGVPTENGPEGGGGTGGTP